MTIFDSDARTAIGYGIAAIVGMMAVAVGMLVAFVVLQKNGLSFVFVLLALASVVTTGWLVWMLRAIASTTYALDRNAFVIRWGGQREIVPMGDVQRVLEGAEIQKDVKVRRLPLPGWWFGEGRHPSLGQIRFYGTEPIANQLIVVTPHMSYAVSPYDADAFIDSFRLRFEMGPTQPVTHALIKPGFMESDLWQDHGAQTLLLISAGLNISLLGLCLALFPSLPTQLPFHFSSIGLVDRLAPSSQLFGMSGIALAWLVINGAAGLWCYQKNERMAAFLAWGGGLVVQLLCIGAVITVAFSR